MKLAKTALRGMLLTASALAGSAAAIPADEPVQITEVAVADLPQALRQTIEAAIPGMQIAEVQRKQRGERVYFDVEGTRPNGAEVELDVLAQGERYEVVEIQRDLPYAEVPAAVRAAHEAEPNAFPPARVIESIQTDGSVIYELFAPDQPADPAREVRVVEGRVEVLRERWQH
jgi:hypothetical protein